VDELLTFSPRFHVRYDVAVIEGKAECRLLTCLCPQPKTRGQNGGPSVTCRADRLPLPQLEKLGGGGMRVV
jgi:hypothetical protein